MTVVYPLSTIAARWCRISFHCVKAVTWISLHSSGSRPTVAGNRISGIKASPTTFSPCGRSLVGPVAFQRSVVLRRAFSVGYSRDLVYTRYHKFSACLVSCSFTHCGVLNEFWNFDLRRLVFGHRGEACGLVVTRRVRCVLRRRLGCVFPSVFYPCALTIPSVVWVVEGTTFSVAGTMARRVQGYL